MQPFDSQRFETLCAAAEDAPRRRAHHLIHGSHQDPVQRLLIALQPGTYVRPHRHTDPAKWELLLCLKGAVGWLSFDDHGVVTERLELGAHRGAKGLENPAGVWHALVCLAVDTVLFECKAGPFAPIAAHDLAPWAPEEGSPRAAGLVRWMLKAGPGERFPAALSP
jgi:cupin fold WbuC family metalloprotein